MGFGRLLRGPKIIGVLNRLTGARTSPENVKIAVTPVLERKSGLRRENIAVARAKRVFLAVLGRIAGLRAGADRDPSEAAATRAPELSRAEPSTGAEHRNDRPTLLDKSQNKYIVPESSVGCKIVPK